MAVLEDRQRAEAALEEVLGKYSDPDSSCNHLGSLNYFNGKPNTGGPLTWFYMVGQVTSVAEKIAPATSVNADILTEQHNFLAGCFRRMLADASEKEDQAQRILGSFEDPNDDSRYALPPPEKRIGVKYDDVAQEMAARVIANLLHPPSRSPQHGHGHSI